ncbi:MAG: hypothetical protein ACJAR0_003645, partial [Candidatus Azotimanducaceae bacterium]
KQAAENARSGVPEAMKSVSIELNIMPFNVVILVQSLC